MKSLFSAAALTASAMLLLALAPLPYGYYTLLRLVVCGVGAYGASLAYGLGKQGWVLILGLIALLFNPLVPVHLESRNVGTNRRGNLGCSHSGDLFTEKTVGVKQRSVLCIAHSVANRLFQKASIAGIAATRLLRPELRPR